MTNAKKFERQSFDRGRFLTRSIPAVLQQVMVQVDFHRQVSVHAPHSELAYDRCFQSCKPRRWGVITEPIGPE